MKKRMISQFTVSGTLSRGALLFRAVLLLLIALTLAVAPLLTLAAATSVIGVLLIFDAFWALAAALRGPAGRARWTGVAYALGTLLFGVLSIAAPLLMDLAWVFVLGCWQLAGGIGWLALAFRREAAPGSRWRAAVSGVLSLLVGLLFIALPLSSLGAMVWLLSILCAVLAGFTGYAAFTLPAASRTDDETGDNPA